MRYGKVICFCLTVCVLINILGNSASVFAEEVDQLNSFPQSGETIEPVIKSEFKKLFHPKQTGYYINDHTLVKAKDNKYHLIGITSLSNGGASNELYLAHGVGDQLIVKEGYSEKPKLEDDGKGSWAPHIVENNGTYYMYYASQDSPSAPPADPNEQNSSNTVLRLATSTDMYNWTNETSKLNVERIGRFNRDPMVLKVGDKWLLYATWIEETTGRSVVSLFESSDLYNWSFEGYALVVGEDAVHVSWGSTESPFVFYRDGYYYLSVTLTDCDSSNYEDTLIFRSKDPRNFGYYNGKGKQARGCEYVTKLKTHAPEYFYENGKWYITAAGWKNMASHDEAKRGVAIAELDWVTPSVSTTMVDDRDSSIIYSGKIGYHESQSSAYYNKTITIELDTGAASEFTFTGTQIKWISLINKDLGIADVYIDGKLEKTVDCYNASLKENVVLFTKTGLKNSTHTIKIVRTGRKNVNATNYYIVIDAFEYGVDNK